MQVLKQGFMIVVELLEGLSFVTCLILYNLQLTVVIYWKPDILNLCSHLTKSAVLSSFLG